MVGAGMLGAGMLGAGAWVLDGKQKGTEKGEKEKEREANGG